MAGDTIKLTGFKELDAGLAQFKKTTERAILRRVAVKALEPVAERAKQLAPVDEGDLRDSIVVGTNVNKAARADARRDPVQGVRVYVGTSNRNGVPREFGTVRSAADPFLRPAWDTEQDGVLDTVKEELAAEIDKTAARVAKRGK